MQLRLFDSVCFFIYWCVVCMLYIFWYCYKYLPLSLSFLYFVNLCTSYSLFDPICSTLEGDLIQIKTSAFNQKNVNCLRYRLIKTRPNKKLTYKCYTYHRQPYFYYYYRFYYFRTQRVYFYLQSKHVLHIAHTQRGNSLFQRIFNRFCHLNYPQHFFCLVFHYITGDVFADVTFLCVLDNLLLLLYIVEFLTVELFSNENYSRFHVI